jgi:hypothetical protein
LLSYHISYERRPLIKQKETHSRHIYSLFHSEGDPGSPEVLRQGSEQGHGRPGHQRQDPHSRGSDQVRNRLGQHQGGLPDQIPALSHQGHAGMILITMIRNAFN